MVSFEGEGDAVVPTPSQDVDRAPVSPHRVSILGHFLEPEVDKDLTRKSEVALSSEVRARSIPCSIFLFSRIFLRSSPYEDDEGLEDVSASRATSNEIIVTSKIF